MPNEKQFLITRNGLFKLFGVLCWLVPCFKRCDIESLNINNDSNQKNNLLSDDWVVTNVLQVFKIY